MRTTILVLLAVIGAAAVLGAASSSAATATWQAEFTRDVATFTKASRHHAPLVREYPRFEEQFSAFSIYAGELKAESRQLEALAAPQRCSEVQEKTVRLLRRASRTSEGLGDYKDLTPGEFARGTKELGALPTRLAGTRVDAQTC